MADGPQLAAPPAASVAAAPAGGHEDLYAELRSANLMQQFVETLQTVLTALILAFIFRAYMIEAFIIPTGSMAESLLGEHGTRVCERCGWEYDYGPIRSEYLPGEAFQEDLRVRCPNCHAALELELARIVTKSGDRILVHKWPYVIGGPFGLKRWDVIVFKDPHNPLQNFIKRLIALPGETVQIIDGDIYIKTPGADEFRIARKTPAAQSVLWSVVFDQDHLSDVWLDDEPEPPWIQEGGEAGVESGWRGLDTRRIEFVAGEGAGPRAIRFSPTGSRYYLQDVLGYNRGSSIEMSSSPPLVGDVRLTATLEFADERGVAEWEIERDGRTFRATLSASGNVTLASGGARSRTSDTERGARFGPATSAPVQEWTRVSCAALRAGRPLQVEFGHLDCRVYVKIDGREVAASNDDQYAPNTEELVQSSRVAPLGLRIVASGGSLSLRGLRIDRDVHYLAGPSVLRASPRSPFALREKEYFVLGDNSPHSHDARSWQEPGGRSPRPGDLGPHLRGRYDAHEYRIGTIPEDQIVGRAFFVYLPGLMATDERVRWRVPDLGRTRLVR